MAKKQFIRHLEFYGFPDQNKYTSFEDIDLSDIREKNKEQDEEIQGLEGEKAEKKDLNELSGTVENLIAAQSEVNEAFAEAISGMSGNIDELAEEVSALTDTVNDVIDNLEDLSASTNFNIAELRQGFNAYTKYADMEFAHRNNVYTKQEIDDMFASGGTSGYATVEWVEEQGYLTEESGNTLYVRQDAFDEYSGGIDTRLSGIESDVASKYQEFVDYTAYAPSIFAKKALENEVSDLSAKTLQNTIGVLTLSGNVKGINDSIEVIDSEIVELSGKVESNKSAIEYNKDEIARRVTQEQFNDTVNGIKRDIASLEVNKADLSDLTDTNSRVNTISGKLETEINQRIAQDQEQTRNISNLTERVISAETTVMSYGDKIDNIESGLTKEIQDRINGDEALIGSPNDSSESDTINGAKRYAVEQALGFVESAKTYTDTEVKKISDELADLSANTDTRLSAFATEDWVNERINETFNPESGSVYSLSARLETEIVDRKNGDIALEEMIDELDDKYSGLSEDVSHAINQLGALTEWDGENPDDYEPWSKEHPSANGIVDILHREFHKYIKDNIIIESIYVDEETGELVIKCKDAEGKESEIRIDLTNFYYTKTEIDDKFNTLIIDCGIY